LARRSDPVSIELVAFTALFTHEMEVGKLNPNRIHHARFVASIE